MAGVVFSDGRRAQLAAAHKHDVESGVGFHEPEGQWEFWTACSKARTERRGLVGSKGGLGDDGRHCGDVAGRK
jgi:hypothetical protein